MIVSLANFKSSVGKTTTAINLAGALIEQGHSVRLWDLDGQKDLLRLGRALNLPVEAPMAITLKSSISANPADFHIIECTPRKEFESSVLAALELSNRLIIPAECEYMMLRGVGSIQSTVEAAQKRNAILQWRALVTKYKTRQKRHLASFMASGDPRFETIFRDSAWIADAFAYQKTVLQYAPRSAAARAYRALAKEVVEWK